MSREPFTAGLFLICGNVVYMDGGCAAAAFLECDCFTSRIDFFNREYASNYKNGISVGEDNEIERYQLNKVEFDSTNQIVYTFRVNDDKPYAIETTGDIKDGAIWGRLYSETDKKTYENTTIEGRNHMLTIYHYILIMFFIITAVNQEKLL